MATSPLIPSQVERVGQDLLRIHWSDSHESLYPWVLLRNGCPCAVCREVPPHADPKVYPLEMFPVGRYALGFRWSDGHATGIFSFELLRSLCPCEACRPTQWTEG